MTEKSYGISEPELIKNDGKITKEQQIKNYKQLLELNIDLPFDIESVDPYCHACVLSQLKKYEKFHSEHSGSAENKFSIPCTGIPLEPVPKELKSGFNEKEWKEIEAQSDITKWAEKYLKDNTGNPWTARWYQSKTLQCSSRRKSLRISRRSGKTTLVCVEICYYLFTNPGRRLLVIGPQKSQTEEIINRVKEFIACNPELQECVTRSVAAPYYKIQLSNGSELRGFAAGDDGKSIRGQDGDRIYIEEAHFVPEKAFVDAVLPILQTHPNTSLIAFSTPNAMVTTFYRLCKQNPAVKETHYTYRVLPHKASVEADRNNYTEEQWDGEFEASFGSSSDGVYKVKYIDNAAQKYNYEDHSPKQGWKYIIGTDWNEKYGAEIYVVGWSPFDKRFHGVESIHVEPTQFTQLSAVSKLLETVRKWDPHFVYTDIGNGSSNVELLLKTALKARKHGTDPKVAKLINTLKPYDSGAKIEIKDPITGEKVKKPAKPFMINASVRTLEQGRFYFPSIDKKLESQFKNYIIERYTPTGNPVYGQNDPKIGDHRLDALNLALVGFHIEFDDLYKIELPATRAYSLPDPRKLLQQENHKGSPKDRRMVESNVLSGDNFFNIPARSIKSSNMQTNRLGWHTDTEEIEMEKYLQKRRKKNKMYNRPQRTTF